jgi:hypothetical protein
MYLMPRERGIDMDEPVDLAVVTLILEHRDRFDALLEDFGARGVPP